MAFVRDSGEKVWEYTFNEPGWAWRDVSIETDEDTVYVSCGGELLALRSGVEDDPEPESGLELSVSAPESAPYREEADSAEDAVEFEVSVTNHGDESVSADVTLEISPIDEPVTLELAPGEADIAHYGVMTRDPGVGDHEWTVTAGDETETGTLTVTDGDELEDDVAATNRALSVRAPDSIVSGESVCFDITVRNEFEETVEVSITLDVAAIGDSTVAEIEPGDTYASFHTVHCSELSGGENKWFVTAGGESESGTLVVE